VPFESSAVKQMSSAPFWDITYFVMVIPLRLFLINYSPQFLGPRNARRSNFLHFLTHADGTDRLSEKVCKKFPLRLLTQKSAEGKYI